ncbi:X-linked retinitis pigmentosa GTPase regulator-interacting protein 1, partial [Ophiophagus hannah]
MLVSEMGRGRKRERKRMCESGRGARRWFLDKVMRKLMAKPEFGPGKRGSVRKKLKVPFLDQALEDLILEPGAIRQFILGGLLFAGLAYPEGLRGVSEKLGKAGEEEEQEKEEKVEEEEEEEEDEEEEKEKEKIGKRRRRSRVEERRRRGRGEENEEEEEAKTLVLDSGLTLGALGRVELLHRVVKPDADRGEAHLALEAGHQPVVETLGSFHLHHGGDGTQDALIFHLSACFASSRFPLNLGGEVRGCVALSSWLWSKPEILNLGKLKSAGLNLPKVEETFGVESNPGCNNPTIMAWGNPDPHKWMKACKNRWSEQTWLN